MNLELKVIDLGLSSYADAWKIQKELFEKRKNMEIEDTLILTEHMSTITFGKNKEWNTLHVPVEYLRKEGIEFFGETPRGGGAAYLGPGQLIGYTIMDIKPYGGVKEFMIKLEEVMIRSARDFRVEIGRYDVKNPTTDKPYRATWYRNNGNDYVLCTKGIGVHPNGRGTYTHHGFSLNVNSEKSYFHLIDPCGFPLDQVRQISLQDIIGKKIDMDKVKKSVIKNFREVFEKNG